MFSPLLLRTTQLPAMLRRLSPRGEPLRGESHCRSPREYGRNPIKPERSNSSPDFKRLTRRKGRRRARWTGSVTPGRLWPPRSIASPIGPRASALRTAKAVVGFQIGSPHAGGAKELLHSGRVPPRIFRRAGLLPSFRTHAGDSSGAEDPVITGEWCRARPRRRWTRNQRRWKLGGEPWRITFAAIPGGGRRTRLAPRIVARALSAPRKFDGFATRRARRYRRRTRNCRSSGQFSSKYCRQHEP